MKRLFFSAVLALSWLAVPVSAQLADPPSPLIADVFKLVRAKVNENVILVFIQSSTEKAVITASELLELHTLGASPRIQIALINQRQSPAEPAPLPAEPPVPKAGAGVGEAGLPGPVSNVPEPVPVITTTEYVPSPVYIGVGSAYYPDGLYCGLGWGLSWGVGWWGWCGWNSYPYGYCWYPWYGYGYGYHCGYSYPSCGDGRPGHYYTTNPNPNPNNGSGSSAGKNGVHAIGGMRGSAEGQSHPAIVRPGPAGGSGKEGTLTKIQPGGSGNGATADQAAAATKPTGNLKAGQDQSRNPSGKNATSLAGAKPGVGGQSVKPASPFVRNPSNPATPTDGSGPGTKPGPGAQSVKPALAGAPRTGPSGASPGRLTYPGQGTGAAPSTKPAVGANVASAPRSSYTPGRGPVVYSDSGANGYSKAGNVSSGSGGGGYSGYSGFSSAPSRGYSGSSATSRGYSGGGYSVGGSRGGYSGFSGYSGSRGGGGGGFSGGSGGRR